MDRLGTLKLKKTRVIYNVLTDYSIVVVVGLGSKEATFNEQDELDEKKNNIRLSIATAVNAIRSIDIKNLNEIHLDGCDDPEQVAIGAVIADWQYDELKNQQLKRKPVKFLLADQSNADNLKAFERGVITANIQNVSRRLQETPANIMTPTRYQILFNLF